MGLFTNVATRISGGGRRLRRREYTQAKRQAYHQINTIREAQQFRSEEDPREQAALKQGMFARGLGKSTIHNQDWIRLSRMQANNRAQLQRQRQIAEANLSLIKKRWRYSKRIQWAQSVDDLLSLVGGVATVYGAASGNVGMQAAGGAMQGAGGMGGAATNY